MLVEDHSEIISFSSSGAAKLYGQWWNSVEDPEALLVVTHGLGEHIGRYNDFAKKFTDINISVFGYDLRGHGHSSGKRGHAGSLDELLVDLQQAMMKARLVHNDIPLYLFGHSLGGNIVANYLLRIKSKEVSGAILSSPWLGLAMDTPLAKRKLGRLMNTIWPSFTTHNSIEPEDLSSVPSVIEQYKQDPLNHHHISSRMFFSNLEAGKFAVAHADKLSVPVLICHGTEDKITSIADSKRFAENAGKMAEFHSWEGARHEPHQDERQNEVVNYYVEWIRGQIMQK